MKKILKLERKKKRDDGSVRQTPKELVPEARGRTKSPNPGVSKVVGNGGFGRVRHPFHHILNPTQARSGDCGLVNRMQEFEMHSFNGREPVKS
jgi:hypothetical protein